MKVEDIKDAIYAIESLKTYCIEHGVEMGNAESLFAVGEFQLAFQEITQGIVRQGAPLTPRVQDIVNATQSFFTHS